MIPLDRALVSSYRPSIVTISLPSAVCLQFGNTYLGEGSIPLFWGGERKRKTLGFQTGLGEDRLAFSGKSNWEKEHRPPIRRVGVPLRAIS